MPRWMIKDRVLSDYLQACKEAVGNPLFKRDDRLQRVFEHTSKAVAIEYMKEVMHFELFRNTFTNDDKGGATFERGLLFSNSTYQYIGVLNRIAKYFGSLDGLRICEIGGGYGGQAKTIFDVYKPSCYHIIDLPEVCSLQKWYEPRVGVFTEPTGEEYDIVISNYALSEIVDNKLYIDEVLAKSKHGYITCNTDFVQLPWPHSRYPDIAGERKENYILVW